MAADQESVWNNLLGCLVAPFMLLLIPFILLLNLLGLNKMKAGPEYVIEYLEKFISGTEGEWDWDDFCSIPLVDPTLESIRERACELGSWAKPELDVTSLQELLEQARALQAKSD